MSKVIDQNFNLVVKSKVCVTPTQCYEVETLIPWYVTAVLAGSVVMIIREIIK